MKLLNILEQKIKTKDLKLKTIGNKENIND